jgi:hypothetical protein
MMSYVLANQPLFECKEGQEKATVFHVLTITNEIRPMCRRRVGQPLLCIARCQACECFVLREPRLRALTIIVL